MKNHVIVFVLATLLVPLASAQWSHREGDPVPHPPGHLVQPFTAAEWEASNFADEKDLQWFRDAKYGMFIHFGLSTRHNAELSWGTSRTRKAPDYGSGPIDDPVWQAFPEEFHFEQFDAEEWVAIAQEAGFKYMVVIAKHHDGFHLWDTALSDFKVTHTPFGRDYLKELADAAQTAGMPFGIYYSQRDWYHPDYMPVDPAKVQQQGTRWTLNPGETSPLGERHQQYIDYQFAAVRELCTKYGKLDIFWWDALWWGGMFTPDMWDAERLTRMVRELQPGILLNNRSSLPGDFDTPEHRLGYFQDWRPWESCMTLTSTWSYSGTPPKSRDEIIRMIVNNACCDGNLLLSWGPQWNGAFAPAEKARLLEVGEWLQRNGTAIYGTRGGPWRFTTWGGSTRRGNNVWLHVLHWDGETLRLPALPGRQVISARLLSGEPVDYTQAGGALEINVPRALQKAENTIIELTMDQSVDGLPSLDAGTVSLFSDPVTYGHIISREATVTTSSALPGHPREPNELVGETPAADFAFHTQSELNPWVQLDLGREFSVTGLRVRNRVGAGQPGMDRAATLRVSVSDDGQAWHEVWKADSSKRQWEVPVTDYVAGAHIPGRKARYLRLELKPAQPEHFHLRQVEVWGKKLD